MRGVSCRIVTTVYIEILHSVKVTDQGTQNKEDTFFNYGEGVHIHLLKQQIKGLADCSSILQLFTRGT